MTAPRGLAVPLAAGLAAGAAAFGAVALAGGGEPPHPVAPAEGRAVFAAMGCGSCHRLAAAGSQGQIGPNLDARLPAHTASSLRAVILAPGRGGMMPEDFGTRMTPQQLDALVAFLLASRSGAGE